MTDTEAVPLLEESAVDVALTVRLEADSLEPTVKRPLKLMEVPDEPPETDQVTLCDGLLVPFTTALNCLVEPLATEVLEGDTVTLVTVAGGGGHSHSQAHSQFIYELERSVP